jgi:antitoxin component YwqK of YwqJK toxin-antitoxin module
MPNFTQTLGFIGDKTIILVFFVLHSSMKTLISIIFLCSFNSFSQESELDSILYKIGPFNEVETFREWKTQFYFKNKSTKLDKEQLSYNLDSLLYFMKFYKGCDCDIYLSLQNKEDSALNVKRMLTIKNKLLQSIPNFNNLNIIGKEPYYYRLLPEFMRPETLKKIQRIVYAKVNCWESFHVFNSSEPFTGYHAERYFSGEILRLNHFVQGIKQGENYQFNKDGTLVVIHNFKDGVHIDSDHFD